MPPSPKGPIQLLVVDDDPMMRMLVKGNLDEENYDIDEAVNGIEGLFKLSAKDYDLAIVDLHMPGMNGEQLLSQIREKNKYIGLVVLTSESNIDVSFRLLDRYDISDYLTKPLFSDTQLRFSIRNALSRRTFLIQQDGYIARLEFLRHQAELSKSHFLTQMSHELNTPMNVILGFSQLLENMEEGFNERQKDYIKHIVKAGWSLMDMIEKILKLSSVEFDVMGIKQENVQLDKTINEVISNLTPELQRKNITIKYQPNQLSVIADQVQLRAVLYSLISNAIIFNKTAGTIKIDGQITAQNEVSISIADTGSGISPENLANLFTPFERMGVELKTVSGAGVSLALAKRLISAMQGSINCKSKIDFGSTFTVTLPLMQS